MSIKLSLVVLAIGLFISLATGVQRKGLADDAIPAPGTANRGLPLPWLRMRPLKPPHDTIDVQWTLLFIDTVFWALVALVPVTIVFERRESRRKHREESGLCGECGYNLRGNVTGICSECGRKLDGMNQT